MIKLVSANHMNLEHKGLEVWMVSKEYQDMDDNVYYLFLDKEFAHKKYLEWLPCKSDIRQSEECRCEYWSVSFDDKEDGIKDRKFYENNGMFYWYAYDEYGSPEKSCLIYERKVVIPIADEQGSRSG